MEHFFNLRVCVSAFWGNIFISDLVVILLTNRGHFFISKLKQNSLTISGNFVNR